MELPFQLDDVPEFADIIAPPEYQADHDDREVADVLAPPEYQADHDDREHTDVEEDEDDVALDEPDGKYFFSFKKIY